mgnify:CR=1 FL=1
MIFADMKKQLAQRLKPSRYEHSVGVADTAVSLAQRFGVSVEQARVAGLLHDCAREFPNETMLLEARRRNIHYGPVEEALPLLLHAYIGAQRVKECYDVDDPEISQAIYRHTVGGSNMTVLDKIIYFSDMIEPHRDYPGVEQLRRLSKEASLDDMVFAGLNRSIAFVLKKNHLIHPDTVLARNEILLKEQRA